MQSVSLWLFFPIAITLHNLEEAIWLPAWTKHAKQFHKPVEANVFYFAVIFVTILAYLSTFLAVAFPSSWFWKYVFHGFLGAMILNIIFVEFYFCYLGNSFEIVSFKDFFIDTITHDIGDIFCSWHAIDFDGFIS